MEHKERISQLSVLGKSIRADLEDNEMILPCTSQEGDRPVTGTVMALGSDLGHRRQQFKRAFILSVCLPTHPTPTSLTHALSLAQTLSAPSAQLAIRLLKSPNPGYKTQPYPTPAEGEVEGSFPLTGCNS